jgi:NAD(P)-dependent dehydrogenase (short-subunit alcohol dehydrogenase family)
MRVFVAGATGVIGKQLVPRLVAAGHEVHGMTHSEAKEPMLYDLGAAPVVADALDPDRVAEAVARAKPDVVVHQLTAIAAVDTRHMERDFAPTNRLRTEGTDYLLSAAQAVGVRRFVAQSNAAFLALEQLVACGLPLLVGSELVLRHRVYLLISLGSPARDRPGRLLEDPVHGHVIRNDDVSHPVLRYRSPAACCLASLKPIVECDRGVLAHLGGETSIAAEALEPVRA